MKTRLFRLACAIVPLLLSACAGGAPAAKPQQPAANEIVIGVAGPMSGDLAAFGEQLKHGARQAVADLNAAGGVLGKQVRLVEGDDQCDPKRAVRVANELVGQGVVFVAGHFCSGSSIPASAVYAEDGILQITPASTNPRLTDDAAAHGIKTLFRACGRDDMQGTFAGAWLVENYPGKPIAVIDDNSPYGAGLARETERVMASKGVKLAVRDTYAHMQQDFSALIANLKSANVAAVYVGGYHNDIGLLVRQAREQGFAGDFAAADALNTAEFWRIAGSAGEGVRFTDASSAVNFTAAKEVVEKFRAANYEPEGYTLSSYAAIQGWAEAAEIAGSTDAAKVAGALRGGTIPTVIGDLSWDAKGDLTHVNYAWFVWHNGQYTEEP